MDPDEALRLLIDALAAGDLPVARGHFADLDGWLSRGGFPPGPVGTRANPARFSYPHPVDQAVINARVADDAGEGPAVDVDPGCCHRCGFTHPPQQGHPVPRNLYLP